MSLNLKINLYQAAEFRVCLAVKAFCFVLFSLLILSTTARAQQQALNSLLTSARTAPTDSQRIAHHDRALDFVRNWLQQTNLFTASLDSLSGVNTSFSSDGKLRWINWNVELLNASHLYGGFLLMNNEDEGPGTYFELTGTPRIPRSTEQLGPNEWYGALYYSTLAVGKKRSGKYLLLGWLGADGATTAKVAEVIDVSRKKIKLGVPSLVVSGSRVKQNRLVRHYAQGNNVTLLFDPERQWLVTDKLTLRQPALGDVPQNKVKDIGFDLWQLEGETLSPLPAETDYRPEGRPGESFIRPEAPDMNRKRDSVNPLTGEPR